MLHLFAYLQDEWLFCKILARQRVILQDLARFWKKILQHDELSCKILPESCKILQDNHSLSTGVVKLTSAGLTAHSRIVESIQTCTGIEIYVLSIKMTETYRPIKKINHH